MLSMLLNRTVARSFEHELSCDRTIMFKVSTFMKSSLTVALLSRVAR